MKQKEQKVAYLAPSIEVIEMENEGVIASSNTLPVIGSGGDLGVSPNIHTKSYSAANSSDLEDMINDILTIEN